jgi:error-prone DNA polymerase
VVIEVAIVRPGPIQGDLMHPYLRRRDNLEKITYYDESLEPVLKPVLERTKGVPLFQEQMLEMAMVLADFSWRRPWRAKVIRPNSSKGS